MSVIPKEQILRLNCPGFGEESYLTIGKARALDSYSVIVVNPISILHLFDRDPESTRDIDAKLNEGLTSYSVKSDELLHMLETDLKTRIFELVSFLEKGGLLVYYLCRPFMVQAPSVQMDNYYWLESLAPDTPAESNVRHMSAVSHGRIVEPSEQADRSEFAAYFKQPGLEWSTIIRTDFLTEGYIVLATAGPRKCIAAHLIAGDNGGRILFLPAPYSPDFDRTLMECVNIWHDRKSTGSAIGMGAESAAAKPAYSSASPAAQPAEASVMVATAAPLPAAAPSMFAGLDDAPYQQPAASLPQVPNSRLSSSPRASSTNLPPVPKFNPTTSRQMPGISLVSDEAEPRLAKLTAEEILDAVSAHALNAAETTESGATPFNERKTSDIESAFRASNTVLPQVQHSSSPPGSDLLRELETMSAETAGAPPTAEPYNERDLNEINAGTEPPSFVKPDSASFFKKSDGAPKVPPPSRNLLRELESMTSEHPPETETAPTESGTENSFDASIAANSHDTDRVPTPSLGAFTPPPPPQGLELEEAELNEAATPDLPDYNFGIPAAAQATDVQGGYKFGEETHKIIPLTDFPVPNKEIEKVETQPLAPVAPSAQPINPRPAIQPPPEPVAPPPREQREQIERARLEPAPEHSAENNKPNKAESNEAIPEAKDLIKKMEEMTKTIAPDWCAAFTFPDLEELKHERDALSENIRQTQQKIAAIDNKITMLDGLKNALLGAEGEELKTACSRVFKRIGWVARQSDSETNELLLVGQEKAEVIARIVRSPNQAPRQDIASLAQSVLTFWGETEIEPKGLLVAATWIGHAPKDRTDSDFSDPMADFAQKKSLCLMTTMQLLCMYRDLELGKVGAEEIRRKVMETNGRLIGFNLEPARTTA